MNDDSTRRRVGRRRRSRLPCFECFEPRNLLAGDSASSSTWIPEPADNEKHCNHGLCYSEQVLHGAGAHTYQLFGDSSTKIMIIYDPLGPHVNETTIDGAGSAHLMSVTTDNSYPYEMTIYNAYVPTLSIKSQWDEDPKDSTLGPFLFDVALQNKSTLSFEPQLPGELQVQYQVGKQASWISGSEFVTQIANLKEGHTPINVRVLDPTNALLYHYDYYDFETVKTVNTQITLSDRPASDPNRSTANFRDLRFIQGVDVGNWEIQVAANYVSMAQAYVGYDFALGFFDPGTDVPLFSVPLSAAISGHKLEGTVPSFNIDANFRDRVTSAAAADYEARIVAKPPTGNFAYSRPFTNPEPVEVTRIPDWMDVKPSQIEYQVTDVFGVSRYAYVMHLQNLTLSQELPPTSGTPLGLFDGKQTNMSAGLALTVYAPANWRIARPVIKSDGWFARATLLDEPLVDREGHIDMPFDKDGIKVTAVLEPHTLGLNGAGILVQADPVVFAKNTTLFESTYKGFTISVPFFSAGAATIDGHLTVSGKFKIIATDVSLNAQVLLLYQNGQLVLDKNDTFVRLNLNGSAELSIQGNGSLGVSAGFKPPAIVDPKTAAELEDLRVHILDVVAEGVATANLGGQIQANFFGPLTDLDTSFDKTKVTLSGQLKLRYATCFLSKSAREFLHLPPCSTTDDLQQLDSRPFGPKVILGPSDPDPPQPSGNGIGPGSDSGGNPEGETSTPNSLSPPAGFRGALLYNEPLDDRLQQIRYDLQASANVPTPDVGAHWLETWLVSGDQEYQVDRLDLGQLDFAAQTHSTGILSRTVDVPSGLLSGDRAYYVEFRLARAVDASDQSVDVTIDHVQYGLDGPHLVLSSPGGTLADGELAFGTDSNGLATAALAIENDRTRSLHVSSVEIVGNGFALVDPPPGEQSIDSNLPRNYQIRLLNPSAAVDAVLRIQSDDLGQPTFDLRLHYDGHTPLVVSDAPLAPTTTPGAPSISPIANQVFNEGTELVVPVVATNPDSSHGIDYSLVAGPAYATIDSASGVVRWNPPESYGSGRYSFRVRAADSETSSLASEQSFEVELRETNQAPRFDPVAPLMARPEQPLNWDLTARDDDFPAQHLTYSLGAGNPSGASIDPETGHFSWTPPMSGSSGDYEFRVQVTDDGTPPAASTLILPVHVVGMNLPPILDPIPDQSATEGLPWTVTVTAVDPNGVAPHFQLGPDAPSGATIDATTGVVQWTPGESDGGRSQAIPVEVVDGADSSIVVHTTIDVAVAEVNSAASIVVPNDGQIDVDLGQDVDFLVTYTDADVPASFKTFQLVGPDTFGATLAGLTGEFRWQPTAAGDFNFTVRLFDPGVGGYLTIDKSVTIHVHPDQTPPNLSLVTPSSTSSPWAIVAATDSVGVTEFLGRFLQPLTPYVDLATFVDPKARGLYLSSDTLSQILGAPFEEGTYTFEVEAFDASGNDTLAQQTFSIDYTPPQPAQLDLAADSDPDPSGDRRTQLSVVTLVGTAEPLAKIVLQPLPRNFDDALPPSLTTTADDQGAFTLSGVPLSYLGRNNFEVSTIDVAGNSTYSYDAVIRLTANGQFGPDGFGYVARSVPTEFDDISATGNLLLSIDTAPSAPLSPADLAGFQFRFYGHVYDSMFVNKDGYLTFVSDPANSTDGGGVFEQPIIAPFEFASSYSSDSDSGVYWQLRDVSGGQELVLQWDTLGTVVDDSGVNYFDQPLRFQAILSSVDGSIQFNYQTLIPNTPLSAWDGVQVLIADTHADQPVDAALLIAAGNGPYDLTDQGTSVRIELSPEPFPPLLLAMVTAIDNDGEPLRSIVSGKVLDDSGIAALTARLVGQPLNAAVDITPLVQASGAFTLDTPELTTIAGGPLPDGQHSIELTATDGAGQSSQVTVTFTTDVTAPVITRLELSPTSDSPPVFADGVTDHEVVTLIGSTEPFVDVSLAVGALDLVSTTADEAGRFQFDDVPLELGDNTFDVTVTDAARNASQQSITVSRVAGHSTMPDTSDYWAQSVPSQFIDIAGTGTPVLVGSDTGEVELDETQLQNAVFHFYGQDYSRVRISANGFLLFGDQPEPPYEEYFLEYSPLNAAVVPLGADLVVSGTPDSAVYWQLRDTSNGQQLVVQWNNVTFDQGDDTPITFQVCWNFSDQSIQFNYGSLSTSDYHNEAAWSAVGIKDAGWQDTVGNVLELSPYGSTSEFVGSGKSIRFTNELMRAGAPHATIANGALLIGVPLTSLDVTFDRSMDSASFSAADDVVSFTGPSGDLRGAILDTRWVDSRTLRFNLVPQSAPGDYRLTIDPAITSARFEVPLDQDRDGLAGEAGDDQISGLTTIADCLGPDLAGYSACDTPFEPLVLDPTSPDTFIVLAGVNDGSTAVDLGTNSFRYYDGAVTGSSRLFVSTNGLITIGNRDESAAAPDWSNPLAAPTIAPLWSDWGIDEPFLYHPRMVLGRFQDVTGDAVPDRLILQWQGYEENVIEDVEVTFQAILELNTIGPGTITFQYPQLDLGSSTLADGFPATVGIASAASPGGARLLVSSPTAPSPLVREGHAIQLANRHPAASMEPSGAPVDGSPLASIDVRFSSAVDGFDPADLVWTRDGVELSGAGISVSGGPSQFVVQLATDVQVPGHYALLLPAASSDITAQSTGASLFADAGLTWFVAPVNHAPTDIHLSSSHLSENPDSPLVGNLTVIDADPDQTYQWQLSDTRFVVEDGMLKVVVPSRLDHESEPQIDLTIVATDSGVPPLSVTKTITLFVDDRNDRPSTIQLIGTGVAEGVVGADVGQLVATDPDAGETLEFQITDPRFEVVGDLLRLKSGQSLNAADGPEIRIAVTAVDQGSPSQTLSGAIWFSLLVNTRPWQNSANPLDTFVDHIVAPVDALVVINELNEPKVIDGHGKLPTERAAGSTLPYFDVNGDGFCSPVDALMVINELNRLVNAESSAGAEGEGVAPTEWSSGPLDAMQLGTLHPAALGTPVCRVAVDPLGPPGGIVGAATSASGQLRDSLTLSIDDRRQKADRATARQQFELWDRALFELVLD